MNIKHFFQLLLVTIILSSCGTVQKEIIVEQDAKPSDHQIELESTSITDREKMILELDESAKKTFPMVRPVFTISNDWDISFDSEIYKIILSNNRGELTIKHIKAESDEPMEWLNSRMYVFSTMGYVFHKKAYADNLTIIADNRDSILLMGDEFEDFFDPDVVTVIGYLGNIDCIWEITGFIKNEEDFPHLVQLVEGSDLTPWVK